MTPGAGRSANAIGVHDRLSARYRTARRIDDRSEPTHQLVDRFLLGLQQARLFTTGAVITEAFSFLAEVPHGPDRLASFLHHSATAVRDVFNDDGLDLAVRLMAKYADTPMDFSDATLVWLAEQTEIEQVLTLDRRGFSVFRFGRNRRFKLALDGDL